MKKKLKTVERFKTKFVEKVFAMLCTSLRIREIRDFLLERVGWREVDLRRGGVRLGIRHVGFSLEKQSPKTVRIAILTSLSPALVD